MAVFTKTLRKHIFIHPGDQHKIQSAVRMVLMGDRKKFSERMGGALLDVNNIKVIGDHHLAVHGYMSLEVVADFKIFSPTVGMTLQGCINKVHQNYCGCVTMDYFNASLSYPSSLDAPPQAGDVCSFLVKSLVVNGDMLHLKGQLESIDERAQPVEDAGQTDTLTSPKEKHKKKSKRDSETSEVDDQLLVKSSKMNPRQKGEEETSKVNECDRKVNADTSTNSDEKKEKKHKKKKKSKHKEEVLESSTNECDTSGVVLSTDSVFEGEIKSRKKKHKKKVKDEEVKLESSVSEFDSTIDTAVGMTECGDSILENNDTHSAKKKKHNKKRKEEALEATEEMQTKIKSEAGVAGDSLLQNDDENSTKKKTHKKKSKENSLESSMEVEGCDTNIKLEISTTGDSFIGNDVENSAKKKHKKKRKENSLESSMEVEGCDTNIKFEISTTGDSFIGNDVENSAKKKHKKKRKENSLEKSVDITAFNNSEDEFVAVNDTHSGDGNSKEKHKKSKEERVLEQSLSLSNGDASFNGDTEMHGSKSEKKEKKKHKKRRRSEDGDVSQSAEAESKSKRLKEGGL